MGYIAWLQRGSNKLRLDTDPYQLAQGFVPPSIAEVPNVASGTSANKYGGGKLISKRADSAPYSFSVRIMGNSNGHNEALIDRLERFVQSGTEADPVYFCWHASNNIPVEPMYGQWNATRRAKVITGSVYKGAELYGRYNIRDTVVFADVNLLVNPPEGKRQRVATATGGIIEDTIGSADGASRGVIVAEATTNYITNPVFGHSTPLTSWTTGADLISEVVTDGEFVLFGDNAVRLTKKTSGSAYSFYQTYQTANNNTHCLSCYVKKPDSSAVTASDFQLRYGATTSDPSFQAVGNGWYRSWVTFTGASASAEIVGCTPVVAGASLYVDGFQFEEKAYPTPLAYGDLLGCAWSSTAHDSSTTRTAGSLKIPAAECLQPSNFTWWVAFRANTNFADHPSSVYLLEETTTTANVRIGANGQMVFADGTNSAAGAVTAITVGQIVIIHATMDSAGMKLYRNGAQDGATQSTFLPLVSPTFLHVGSYSNATAQANVTILGAGSYNRSLTAAEIAADYTNMVQAAGGLDGYGGRVDWLPYLWTKDGDDVVDNCDDANDGTYNNWGVVASVPGSMPANTIIIGDLSTDFSVAPLWLSNIALSKFYRPTTNLNADMSGTADANSCGGEYIAYTTVTNYIASPALGFTRRLLSELAGREFYAFMRAYDAGTGLQVRSSLLLNTYSSDGEWADASGAASAWRIVRTGANRFPGGDSLFNSDLFTSSVTIKVNFNRATAGADVRVDYYWVLLRPLVKIYRRSGATTTNDGYVLNGSEVADLTIASNRLGDDLVTAGDKIEFEPGKINLLVSLIGDTAADGVITYTNTLTKVYVTPRWALA